LSSQETNAHLCPNFRSSLRGDSFKLPVSYFLSNPPRPESFRPLSLIWPSKISQEVWHTIFLEWFGTHSHRPRSATFGWWRDVEAGSTTGCRVPRLPQWRALQLSLPLLPLAAPVRCFQLALTCPLSGSTEGRLPRLGSVWFRSARPVANPRLASGVAHFRSTDGDPSGLRRTTPPPARPTINCRLTPGSDPLARLVRTTSGFRRLLLQLPACAFRCCNLPACAGCCPLCQTGGDPPTRIGCSTSGFTGFVALGLRPVLLPPAGPSMRP